MASKPIRGAANGMAARAPYPQCGFVVVLPWSIGCISVSPPCLDADALALRLKFNLAAATIEVGSGTSPSISDATAKKCCDIQRAGRKVRTSGVTCLAAEGLS
jgi:hypothetical protein